MSPALKPKADSTAGTGRLTIAANVATDER